MAYQRRSEREAEQAWAKLQKDWATVPGGIAVVGASDPGITDDAAFSCILDAIEDQELGACWRDQQPWRGPEEMVAAPDVPLLTLKRWRGKINSLGEVPWGRGRKRQLLLRRSDLQRIWGRKQPKTLDQYVEEQERAGVRPGHGGVPWKRYCDDGRNACNGWKKNGVPEWGYHDKAFKRAVNAYREKHRG